MADITVYLARKVITMDPGRPEATAIAVMDGKIVSVGSLATMQPWLKRNSHTIDDTFSDKVVMPGFIDPHTHLGMSGSYLTLNYLGPVDSPGPDGMNAALLDRKAVAQRLRELVAANPDPARPLVAWGLDPAMQGGHLHRDELDRISTEKPIWVLSYAPHYVYANSRMIEMIGATDASNVHGVGKYPDGRLNGQFVETDALHIAFGPVREEFKRPENNANSLRLMGRTARRAGITTTADLAFGITEFETDWIYHNEVVNSPEFPIRMALIPLESAIRRTHGEKSVEFVKGLSRRSTEKLFFQGIKFLGDGSYPAMSLRVKFPGYLDGGNGLRGDIPWEDYADRMMPYWKAGIQIHAHANGDETVDATLNALAQLQQEHPRFDHRFTIEHYCLSTPDQARRLKALGGMASVNIYFVHYRGQLHSEQGYGPDRAETTGRLGSLEREGVVFGIHSDFSLVVVPLHPLTGAWIAVERIAADGKTVLAPGERIGIDRALRAITIDAAHILRLDHKLGSIEVGKYADFTILKDDPYTVEPKALKDIPIWGTVLGGVKQPNATPEPG
ncbi:amidohydrolase [Brucella grignonensis]|uniref:amidohydrolase n=2 Tax=Brucella grignonensis TaxID=94627 RepID=UPI0035BBE38F